MTHVRRAATAFLLLSATAFPVAAFDLAEVKTRGQLAVLVVPGSPAFFSSTEGVGFDHDVLLGFARLHRLTLKVVPVSSWDGLVPALLEGKGDVVAGGVTSTEARRKLVGFTAETFPTRLVVLNRKPSPPITTPEMLRAARVGTVKGTSMADALSQARVPKDRMDSTIPSGGLPEALRKGRITACVIGVEDAILAQRADPELQLGMFLGPKQSLALAVRQTDPELKAALDTYVSNLRRTPSWNRLVVLYFGASALEILQKAQAE